MTNPITVTREGDRWVARFTFDYATKDVVKAAGFRFDGANKVWYTRDPKVAESVGGDISEAVAAINAAREAEAARKAEAIAMSRAATSDFKVPLSKIAKAHGWDFFGYQKAGVEFALSRPGTLIADEMGLGKTMQAIGVVNADTSIKNVLVICPASLKLNWRREASRWLARDIPVAIANGKFPKAGFVIINYEMVQKNRKAIDAIEWDLLVCDESHYLKTPTAQRTKAVLGSEDKKNRIAPIAAKRRIFLTGTPILNRPKELWTLVRALDPHGLGKHWRNFVVRYCAGRQTYIPAARRMVWETNGSSNLDELQAKLRESIMVRRLKVDVLTELPAKRRQVIALQPDTAEARAAVAAESSFLAGREDRINAIRAEIEALSVDEASDAYKAATEALRKSSMVEFTETSRVRHEVAVAKIPQVLSHIIDVMESEPKVIVFAHHHDVTDALTHGLRDFGAIKADGRDSTKARDAAVTKFQNDDSCRIIVCGMNAMKEGHTLTAASHVIFAELDWVPGNLAQAEDRAHRIGQHSPVLVTHLVLDGSLDARMAETIVEKMGVIAAAVDGGEKAPEVATIAVPTPKPVQVPNQKSASDGNLEPHVVEAIHTALQMLAGMCDGARRLDGAGFNRMDTDFGHSLANASRLSQRQAMFGKRLAIKYGRQLPEDLLAVIKG